MSELFGNNVQQTLFEGEGQLAEEDVLFLEVTSGIRPPVRDASGKITTLFRAKSYFSIGEPIVLPLAQLLTERGEAIPAEIKLQMQQFDFYQVELACSFQTAPGCRFHDARFALTLQTLPYDSQASPQSGKAIAYDLFPRTLEDERPVRIKRSFAPEIKLNFDSASSSLALPLFERTEEFVSYTARVEAFDLRGTQPAWSFTRTASHEIGGPQKLFMVVRKPKDAQVKAIFSLSAHVQFVIGKIALDPFPLIWLFRRHDTRATITDEPAVPLC